MVAWPGEEPRERSSSSSWGGRGIENPRSPPSQDGGIRKELEIPRGSGNRGDGSEREKPFILLLLPLLVLLPVLVVGVVGEVHVAAQPGEGPRESLSSSSRGGRRVRKSPFATLAGKRDPRGTQNSLRIRDARRWQRAWAIPFVAGSGAGGGGGGGGGHGDGWQSS